MYKLPKIKQHLQQKYYRFRSYEKCQPSVFYWKKSCALLRKCSDFFNGIRQKPWSALLYLLTLSYFCLPHLLICTFIQIAPCLEERSFQSSWSLTVFFAPPRNLRQKTLNLREEEKQFAARF